MAAERNAMGEFLLDLNETGGGITLSPSPLSLSLSKTHFLTMCEFMLDLNDTGGV